MAYLSDSDRRHICEAILRGKGPEAFEAYNVSLLDQALLQRRAYQALNKIAIADSPIKGYFRAHIPAPAARVIVVATIIVGIALYGLCHTWPYYDHRNPATYALASASAALLAVCAGASGWAVAAWISYRNARVQHTINFVTNRFTNDIFSRQTAIFNEHFAGQVITTALISKMATSEDDAQKDAVQAARYLMNYFEFIAVGVLSGDLDEAIVRRTLRGNLVFYTDRCLTWIRELQKTSPKVMEHLVILRDHFREN